MLESLHDLQQQLAKYNTSLYVIQGHPLAMIEKVCDEWNVTKLFFQADKEVRSYILEESVTALARSKNIKVYLRIVLLIKRLKYQRYYIFLRILLLIKRLRYIIFISKERAFLS